MGLTHKERRRIQRAGAHLEPKTQSDWLGERIHEPAIKIPLPRSSIEALMFGALSVVEILVPMNWMFRSFFKVVLVCIAGYLVWKAPLTIKLKGTQKVLLILVTSGLILGGGSLYEDMVSSFATSKPKPSGPPSAGVNSALQSTGQSPKPLGQLPREALAPRSPDRHLMSNAELHRAVKELAREWLASHPDSPGSDEEQIKSLEYAYREEFSRINSELKRRYGASIRLIPSARPTLFEADNNSHIVFGGGGSLTVNGSVPKIANADHESRIDVGNFAIHIYSEYEKIKLP